MKLTTLILAFIFLSINLTYAQIKHALIIAIGNYPESSGWDTISSINDISFIQKALLAQHFGSIKIIQDDAATVKGILNSLEELIEKSNSGDIVVIHISSHGEQLEDEKKIKISGLQECIVGFDAKINNNGAKLTQDEFDKFKMGYLREDDFGAYIKRLRAKLGNTGEVVIFMDLCHASVGIRGFVRVRGGKPPLVSPTFKENKTIPKTSEAVHYGILSENSQNENALAPYVVIGAARAEELDYETVDDNGYGIGSLSYAVSKSLGNLGNEDTPTYRTLFAKIQSVMSERTPNQHPVIEGSGQNKKLFGGHFVKQENFIEVNKIDGVHLTINGGTLLGIDTGAKISIYPVGTTDTAVRKEEAIGLVSRASLYNSEVILNKKLSQSKPSLLWAFIKTRVYKFEPITIEIVSNNLKKDSHAKSFSQAELINIKNGLTMIKGIKFSKEKPDLSIKKGDRLDSVMISSTGYLFDTVANAANDLPLLTSTIERFMQYRFLKKIEFMETGIKVDIKLVPVIKGKPDTSTVRLYKSSYTYYIGDTVMLWVSNPGKKSVYFNVVDMQPDGMINSVVPITTSDFKIAPEELFIKPGQSHLINYRMKMFPPTGNEVYKIFVSEKMINMEYITNTKGANLRGDFTPLEKLFRTSYKTNSRGTPAILEGANGSCYNFLFEIRGKK